MQLWRERANTFNDLTQKSCAVFETSPVGSIASVGAEKLMSEITMAVLDIDEIKSQIRGLDCRTVKILDDCSNLTVSEYRKIRRQFQTRIKKRMMVKNAWFGAFVIVRATVSPGVRQLHPDNQTAIRARRLAMLSY